MVHRILPAALLASLVPAMPATAQDAVSATGDPVPVTSPSANAPGEVEFSLTTSFERARSGRPRRTGSVELGLDIGLAPGLELRLGQSAAYGSIPRAEGEGAEWGGTTSLGLRYQLAEEDGARPAIGLLGAVRAGYGPGATAEEVEAALLLGRTFGEGKRPLSATLNLGWTARLDPISGERPGRYALAAAIGRAVTEDTALVGFYAREQQERGERDSNLLGAGLSHRLREGGPVLGVTAAAGLGRDSPALVLALAVQWQFGRE
ncbi:MAG TPA: hypothetical protein VGN83_05245 [Falsiroseomonas sp.]|jgi:hypothetical protein|nr:hypothetical protein [Falsiroseomonas sp.]